jgi:hypothetical protein
MITDYDRYTSESVLKPWNWKEKFEIGDNQDPGDYDFKFC